MVALLSLVFFSSLPAKGAVVAVTAHEGHFNVNVGDQFEYVYVSLKDSEGDPITDGSFSYPDANESQISEGDHFYIDIDEINMTTGMSGDTPSVYGNFTFADGSTTGKVFLMGYFKAMNSSEYNWTYWQTYYEDKNYTVTVTADYFEYATANASDPNLMRFRWDYNTGAMLEWELHGFWINMMGFGTLSEIFIQAYESVPEPPHPVDWQENPARRFPCPQSHSSRREC